MFKITDTIEVRKQKWFKKYSALGYIIVNAYNYVLATTPNTEARLNAVLSEYEIMMKRYDWCEKNVNGEDWCSFDGYLFAFKDKEKAILFRMLS